MVEVFVCYSSPDEAAARALSDSLRWVHVDVWMDEQLHGDEAWWCNTLDRIRTCAVFIFALSAKSIRSKACLAEFDYAQALGLPVLVVQVGPVDSEHANRFSPSFDYPAPDASTNEALIAAVREQFVVRADLPDPLPAPPSHPYAHLVRLSVLINSPVELSSPVQTQTVSELRNALNDEGDEIVLDDVRSLLGSLRQRNDVTSGTAIEIDELLDAGARMGGVALPTEGFPTATTSSGTPPGYAGLTADEPALPFHEDVHFTVYRPGVVRPGEWTTLLAFAHLGEPPLGADADEDPIQKVRKRAEAILGDRIGAYKPVTQDSAAGLPEDAELTFELELSGFDMNAKYQTFLWVNAFQMVEFQIRAAPMLNGRTARGKLRVHHGIIMLAEIPLAIRVDAQAPDLPVSDMPASAAPYRKIFASYSHADTRVMAEFERYVEALGDRYLQDVRDLRSGELWNERLCDFIREADVFQLFWSRNAMASRFVEREWRYALSLNRRQFVRPTYWEEPMPKGDGMPPPELGRIHFYPLGKISPVPAAPAPAPVRVPAPPAGSGPPSGEAPPPPVQPCPAPAYSEIPEHRESITDLPRRTGPHLRDVSIDPSFAPEPKIESESIDSRGPRREGGAPAVRPSPPRTSRVPTPPAGSEPPSSEAPPPPLQPCPPPVYSEIPERPSPPPTPGWHPPPPAGPPGVGYGQPGSSRPYSPPPPTQMHDDSYSARQSPRWLWISLVGAMLVLVLVLVVVVVIAFK
jgi:hypothetical protein